MSAQRNGSVKNKSITEVFVNNYCNCSFLRPVYFDIDSRSKTVGIGDGQSLGYVLDLQFSRLVSVTLQ